MKTVWKWLIFATLTAYVVGMAIWANSEADKHSCRGIAVTISGGGITDTTTRQGVLTMLSKYPERIRGVPVNRVNTLGIENYLMNLNNFEDVKCFITSQGYLSVNIRLMVPEVRVFDGEASYYMNKDGKRLDSNAEFFVDMPVLTGNFNKKFRPKEILPLIRFIQKDSILRNIVTMYVATDRNNILLVPRFSGHVVNFGDTTRLAEKRDALLTAYRNIMPYKGWQTYDTISVKFKGMIVATRRDKTPLYPFETVIEEDDPEEHTLPSPESDAADRGQSVPASVETHTAEKKKTSVTT